MANQYVGYIPTVAALKRGGYETRPGCGSKLAPEALDMIVAETGKLLHQLFDTAAESFSDVISEAHSA